MTAQQNHAPLGCRQCGHIVLVTVTTSGRVEHYDRCGHPVYHVRQVQVNHRCRPAVRPCRPVVRPVVRHVPLHQVPYRQPQHWNNGHGRCR